MASRRVVKTAQANVRIRFGDENDVLKQAVKQAYENRDSARNAARTQSAGVLGAINETLPAAKKIYRQQGAQQQLAADVYGKDVAGLGNVANSIKAGAALERQNATDSLAQSRSATLTGLTGQRVAARTGRQFAMSKAAADFARDIQDVLDQSKSLAGKEGAYLTSEMSRLTDAQASRALARGNLTERVRHDKAGEQTAQQRADQAGKGASKPKDATHAEYQDAASQIGKGLTVLGQLAPDRDPSGRHEFRDLLVTGHKSQPVYETVKDPTTGKPKRQPKLDKNGVPVMTSDVPALDRAYAVAATQMYYDGHVSRETIKRLKALGFRVDRLPVARPIGKPKNQTQQTAKDTGTALGNLIDLVT